MLLVDRAALLVFAGLPALSLHRNQLTGEILAELSHLPEGPVEEFALDFAHFANGASIHLGVGCGKGRNDTLRTIQRFCHLYSPVSRMWAQPRGEMCGRNSGTTGRPACLRLATASPSRAVFQ